LKLNSGCLARHEGQQSQYDPEITGAFPEDDNLFIQRLFTTFLCDQRTANQEGFFKPKTRFAPFQKAW
jgi:hypothetical protein